MKKFCVHQTDDGKKCKLSLVECIANKGCSCSEYEKFDREALNEKRIEMIEKQTNHMSEKLDKVIDEIQEATNIQTQTIQVINKVVQLLKKAQTDKTVQPTDKTEKSSRKFNKQITVNISGYVDDIDGITKFLKEFPNVNAEIAENVGFYDAALQNEISFRIQNNINYYEGYNEKLIQKYILDAINDMDNIDNAYDIETLDRFIQEAINRVNKSEE